MSLPIHTQRRPDYLIPWGGAALPSSFLAPHFLIVGTASAGKTLCIRMAMRSAMTRASGLRGRLLIYDGKREYYAMLKGMGVPEDEIYILNPADSRCAAWDLAGDINNRDDARNIVDLLIPDENGRYDNPFFPLAVRSLVTEVMMTLKTLSPQGWRLIDVINALRTPEITRRVLNNTREGREVCARYFTEAKEAVGGIISTTDARFLATYETIANMWARCSRSIKLTDWINGHKALLLGYDANRSAVDRINQAVFQRAAQLATSLPEGAALSHGETWIVLDELRFLGKLPMLPELVSFGRTKGVRAVLAPQDIDGLYAVYGEHAANEMLALCGNVGVLHIDSTRTREWAAKYFGEYEAWETDYGSSMTYGSSVNHGGGGSSHGESSSCTFNSNQRIVKRELILSSEFKELPLPNRQNGMHGFFSSPYMGAWRAVIPPDFIDAHLPLNDPTALPFIPRPQTAVAALRWNQDEERKYTASRGSGDADVSDSARASEEPTAKPKSSRPRAPKKKRPGTLPGW